MTGPESPDVPKASIVITTVGDRVDARRLARLLVEMKHAACVQMLPIESIYRWDGGVQEDDEILLLVKTLGDSVAEVEALLAEEHPYETPEVLHIDMDGGSADYLA